MHESTRKISPLSQAVMTIAEALAYKKLERLHKVESANDQVLLDVLKASVAEPYAILFFPGKCFQITPFGMKLSLARMQAADNYLIALPELSEKFLRQVFTGFELVLYKTCHIVLEKLDSRYHWESETTRKRFRRLKDELSVRDWQHYSRIFENVFYVRDAFAHSFIELDEIQYDGTQLGTCFGDSCVGYSRRDAESLGRRIFTDDLKELFGPVMSLFIRHQLEQIDASKFHKLCDRLLMRRSLSP